jgi:3-phosphoshikimate 1-carboxyvinyltransferase
VNKAGEEGESVLENVLESDDLARTIDVLRACGASIQLAGNGLCRITGLGRPPRNILGVAPAPDSPAAPPVFPAPSAPQDCFAGESGTTLRLLAAVLAAGQGAFWLHGLPGLHRRPVDEVITPLRDLGAKISCPDAREGFPPLLIENAGLGANGLAGGEVWASCDKTSQALSGLLLAAPYISPARRVCAVVSPSERDSGAAEGLYIRLGGKAPVSWPYVGMTLQMMERFGVRSRLELLDEVWHTIAWEDVCGGSAVLPASSIRPAVPALPDLPGVLRFCVPSGEYKPASFALEGDWSSASYFLAAGAIGPRPVRISGLDQTSRPSRQGDRAILDILRFMGARISLEADAVVVAPGELRGIDCDLNACPDLVPTVLALAAHAKGESRVRNVGHLRFKESDRAGALVSELTKAGCLIRLCGEDGAGGTDWSGNTDIVLSPPKGGPLQAARREVFNTFGDHRLAMAFSLLGLDPTGAGSVKIRLDNYECVKKSFPGFWAEWEKVI